MQSRLITVNIQLLHAESLTDRVTFLYREFILYIYTSRHTPTHTHTQMEISHINALAHCSIHPISVWIKKFSTYTQTHMHTLTCACTHTDESYNVVRKLKKKRQRLKASLLSDFVDPVARNMRQSATSSNIC